MTHLNDRSSEGSDFPLPIFMMCVKGNQEYMQKFTTHYCSKYNFFNNDLCVWNIPKVKIGRFISWAECFLFEIFSDKAPCDVLDKEILNDHLQLEFYITGVDLTKKAFKLNLRNNTYVDMR